MKVVNVYGCVKILFFGFFVVRFVEGLKLKTHRSGFDLASSTSAEATSGEL